MFQVFQMVRHRQIRHLPNVQAIFTTHAYTEGLRVQTVTMTSCTGQFVHVFFHDGGTGQQDLALLAVGQLLVGVGLDDLDVGIGEGQADGALLVDVGGRQAAGRHRLGGAVALPHLNDRVVVIQELVELLLQLDGQAVAAGEDAL